MLMNLARWRAHLPFYSLLSAYISEHFSFLKEVARTVLKERKEERRWWQHWELIHFSKVLILLKEVIEGHASPMR